MKNKNILKYYEDVNVPWRSMLYSMGVYQRGAEDFINLV